MIGHELGHFRGLDTKFSERFYPIYRGTASAIESLWEAGGEGVRFIALLPAIAAFSYFLQCFSVAEKRISRRRELAADQDGAGVSSPHVIATALVKIHAFADQWQGFQQSAVKALTQGRMFVNASKIYSEVIAEVASPEALEGLAESRLSHPTDSHPPLSARLASLGIPLSEVAEASLIVNPADGAISLLPDAEQREEQLTYTYQMILARQHGIDLNAVPADEEEGSA